MDWSSKDHYAILQVSRTASSEVIRASYKALIQRYHPDRFTPKEEAEKITKRLNQAYAILSDPELRAEYDARLERESREEPRRPDASGSAPRPPPPPPKQPRRQSHAEPASGVRPWVRFWARWIDYSLFWLAVVAAYAVFQPEIEPAFAPFLVLAMVTGLAWVPIEALFLAASGQTPGKWLLRIRVDTSAPGQMTYDVAFNRALRTWWFGCGAGLPLLNLIAYAWAKGNLERDGATTWDKSCSTAVSHQSIGFIRAALAVVLVFTLTVNSSILNTVADKQARELVASEPIGETLPSPSSAPGLTIANVPTEPTGPFQKPISELTEAERRQVESAWVEEHTEYANNARWNALMEHLNAVMAEYPLVSAETGLPIAHQRLNAPQPAAPSRTTESGGHSRVDSRRVAAAPASTRWADDVVIDDETIERSRSRSSNVEEFLRGKDYAPATGKSWWEQQKQGSGQEQQ